MSDHDESAKKPGVVHVYDGIEEMDNHLPKWWVGILWGTILFGFGYWFFFHPGHLGESEQEELARTQAELNRKLDAAVDTSEATLVKLAHDPATIAEAQQTFATTCASCHAAKAQGLVGPNLTDDYWINGGKPADIFRTINEGRVEKGMPAWGKVLGARKARVMAAFVVSLEGTNVPGKEPQGELVKR